MRRLPFNNVVGITVDRVHKDGATVSCPFRPDLTNIHGTLHGGVTATLADVAGGICTLSRYGEGRGATTIDLKMTYLAPLAGKRIRARGWIVKAGRTLCVTRVEVSDGKTLGAVALVSYMIPKPAAA